MGLLGEIEGVGGGGWVAYDEEKNVCTCEVYSMLEESPSSSNVW